LVVVTIMVVAEVANFIIFEKNMQVFLKQMIIIIIIYYPYSPKPVKGYSLSIKNRSARHKNYYRNE